MGGLDDRLKESALFKLGLLGGNKEGCAKKLCNLAGEVEGLVDGSDEGPKEGALLKLGLLEGDGES